MTTDELLNLSGSVDDLVRAAHDHPPLREPLRRFARALLAALDTLDTPDTPGPVTAAALLDTPPTATRLAPRPDAEPDALPDALDDLPVTPLEWLAAAPAVQERLLFKADCYRLLRAQPLASTWDALRDVQAQALALGVDLGFVTRGVRSLPLLALERLERGYRLAALAAVAGEELLTRACAPGLLAAAARAQRPLFDVRAELGVGTDGDAGWVHQLLRTLAADRGEWVDALRVSARVDAAPEALEAALRALLGAPAERVGRPRAKVAKVKPAQLLKPRSGVERAVLAALSGQVLVVVGGAVDHLAVDRLRVSLGVREVVWVEAGPVAAASVSRVIGRGGVPVVVFLPRFSSHWVFDQVRAVVVGAGVPCVLLRAGFHPEGVLRQVAAQASLRVAGVAG
ncbi:hypothetical protein [Deinococcus soli (ex Cha et al. 2016)]|uniref:Uncharacterized protein n=2 Tax=Deinococcus soli (ex Cha et al. 2016) TaxID=1309411 RepID=A0AAE3XC03_9DEIO|nr:hypothetical protein [Deinococcus soli (ex Cha et al. 2016)]MDR6218251.1 hypothetical protein [Deinococcus soli (ex Cha et al. 2016)]MDR6328991.1 hypothetical protein [Deinococcus soli (ex Cha et al. 2016)]MDR6751264.1 hypothetical protein [Deinococcus soli (ex Cha et al. 2016)]